MHGDARVAGRMGTLDAFAKGVPAELTTFVQKTYGMLAFSVVLGAAACWGMVQVIPVREVMTRSGPATLPDFPTWGLILLWLGTLGFSLMGSMVRSGARSGEVTATGLVALVGMVLCSGAMLGPTIAAYVGLGMASTVGAAAVVTAVTFTALSLFVLVTGKDFTFLRGFLFVGFFAFLVAWLVGGFLVRNAEFQWWLAAVGALLFCGYILFDTSAVVRAYGPANMVVPAVIALYLDIFNLFLMLLYLLGGRRRN